MKTSLVLGLGCALGACTFPEITVILPSDGGAPATSASSAAGTTGSTGNGAAGGDGGAAAGGGGAGVGGSCTGSGVAGGGGAGVGGVDPCNEDADSANAMGPECCGNDCDDADADVFPGQPEYFNVPKPNGGGYDYDCDGMTKQDPAQLFNFNGMTLACDVVLCTNQVEGFAAAAVCGESVDDYYKCTGIPCALEAATPPEALRCR